MTPAYLDNLKYKRMLGIYVREQREQLKFTYLELSKVSKIAPSHLKKIEAGEVLVRPKTLETLKQHLALEESHLERIRDVAKVAFIDDLFHLINSDTQTI